MTQKLGVQFINHGAIETRLEKTIEKSRDEKSPVSLIMFDIDHFKKVNDTYGHSIGDIVLKKVSSVAAEYLLKYSGVLGRWGGEEFIGILKGKDLETAYCYAEKIRILIEQTDFIKCSFYYEQFWCH